MHLAMPIAGGALGSTATETSALKHYYNLRTDERRANDGLQVISEIR
jgi:hypothetical protein